jgi:tRNA wybutosine-synthesizing protein 2
MIGSVAVIHGQKPTQAEIEEIVDFRHPCGVLWIESLEDVTRTPKTVLLWGESGELSHKESGYTYILDPAKVMFAQGNRLEKMRVAHLVRASGTAERVADMFAGIGYFSIPMAGAGARVHAMEINPVAWYYLNRTVAENGFSDRIETVQGDCRTHLAGVYDRIVMGHFAAITMLSSALRHVKAGTVIHLHSIGAVEEQIRQQVEGAGFSASIHVHTVKKYRPHARHVVQDVVIA